MIAHGYWRGGLPIVSIEAGPGDKPQRPKYLRPNSCIRPPVGVDFEPFWKWTGYRPEDCLPLAAALLALVVNDAAAAAIAKEFAFELWTETDAAGFSIDVDDLADFARARCNVQEWD